MTWGFPRRMDDFRIATNVACIASLAVIAVATAPGPGRATTVRAQTDPGAVTATCPPRPTPTPVHRLARGDHAIHLPWLYRPQPEWRRARMQRLKQVTERLLRIPMSVRDEARHGEWAWKGGVGMIGVLEAVEAGASAHYLADVHAWLEDGRNHGLAGDIRHPNHVVPAWVAFRLRQAMKARNRYPPDGYVALADRAIQWQHSAPRADGALEHRPGQLWDDTLFMAATLPADYGASLGLCGPLSLAAQEVSLHESRLRATDADGPAVDGLWYHGWDARARDHISGGFWSRGNGWAALATSEVLRGLGHDHPDHDTMARYHVEHLTALLRRQDEATGLWRTVLNEVPRPEDFYFETSGSAAIAAAIYRAIADGLLPRDRLADADRARDAIIEKIAADGTVRGVSAGTGVPPRESGIALYAEIDTSQPQPYGQALVLLMIAAELEARSAGWVW